MSNIRMKLVFVSGAAIAAAALAMLVPGWRGDAEADPQVASADSGFATTRGPFEVAVVTSGVIQPVEVVDVGAQVSGLLAALHVKVGDRVQPGQLLAEVDDRLIRARLVQGQATIESLRAQIKAKHAQISYARASQTRMETLNERNIASRAQAELAQSTTAVLVAEAAALEAQLAGQEAALDGIKLDLGNTRITAPVDGIVTAIVAQRGQTLNANQQAPVVLRISRDRPLVLVARVPEADAERVRPGMPVRFSLLGGSSQRFDGTVDSLMRAPTIINDVVFYDAMVFLDGETRAFAFGRTVQAFVVIDRLACAFQLPRKSLPEGAVPGSLMRVSARKSSGSVITRVVTLRAVNELSGAVACNEAERAGLEASDRIVRIAVERRGET